MPLLDHGIMAELSYRLVLILYFSFKLTRPLYIHGQIVQLLLKTSNKHVKMLILVLESNNHGSFRINI